MQTDTHMHTYRDSCISIVSLTCSHIGNSIAMHTKKTRIEGGQGAKREMDETSERRSEGWMDGGGGRPVTGVCMAREICNEIAVSQDATHLSWPDNRQQAGNALE